MKGRGRIEGERGGREERGRIEGGGGGGGEGRGRERGEGEE